MKLVSKTSTFICAIGLLIGISCQREETYENKAPVANAGVDQFIYWPTNFARLDGSKSIDAENAIVAYEWRKIEGPASFNIVNKYAVQTGVLALTIGIYQFELRVIDNASLVSKDTIRVFVFESNPSPGSPPLSARCDNSSRPEVAARLIPAGKLSVARVDMAVAAVGNLIMFAGGHAGPGIPETWGSPQIDIYNLASQTWSSAKLSVGRYGIAAIGAGNKIFLAGGQNGDGAFNSIYSTVDIYDIDKNSWSSQKLSEARGFLTAATIGDKVFFAGGEKDWDNNNTNKVDIYDISSNTWTTSTLSKPRSYISALTVGNKIFFAGGHIDNRWYANPAFAIDIYDYATDSWSQSNLRDPMGFVGGITLQGKTYWTDGCSVEIRDLNTGTSTFSALFRPGSWYNSNGQNLVVKDNKIIFYTDGSFQDDEASIERSQKFDILDITTNTWSIGVLPQRLDGFSIVSVNNKIYIAGGRVNGVLSDQVWTLEF